MSYVDGGGIYISYVFMQSFVRALSRSVSGAIGTSGATIKFYYGSLSSFFSTVVTTIVSAFNALPLIGQLLFIYAAAHAIVLGGYLAAAYIQKKGVDISLGWFCLKFNIK